MNHFILSYLYILTISILLTSCGVTEEMTDRAADSAEGMEKAYVISLDNTNESVARDVWKTFMNQNNSKVARIKGSKVNISQNVSIAGISGAVDIKSLFTKSGDHAEMKLWFVKDNKYMTPQSDPQVYDIIDRFIDEYFTELEAAQVQIEVDNEEDILADMEKDLKKLRKDNEKLHDDITKAEQTIKESRIKIEQNLQEQDQMAEKMEDQRKVIQQTKRKLADVKSN